MTRAEAKQLALDVLHRWSVIAASKIGRRNLLLAASIYTDPAVARETTAGNNRAIRKALSRPVRL